MWFLVAPALLALALALLYTGRAYWAWVLPVAGLVATWLATGAYARPEAWLVAGGFVALALLFGVVPLRRRVLGPLALKLVAPHLPRMSATEREALEAGTVWWDAELFSGRPRWKRLVELQLPGLSARERAFLDGPVEELCRMVSDWQIAKEKDLPPEVWEFLRRHRFLGMIIPEEYGGHGFSALAHSAVVTKLASRSFALCVTVMVPNSLGPGELLLHYGTDEQKRTWLPRLASGADIPCFALTEPRAGSDAGAIESDGIVCHGEYRGERVLGIRLTWNKRYITLAPIATLIGLAFRLKDPDHLIEGLLEPELAGKEDLGITVALVPADLPGVESGARHDPMGVPFHNGPTSGKDVFVPLDAIIGGTRMAGKGWRMLMQCLAAGRGISLPSQACAAGQLAVRGVGAYASVREQFGMAIGRFEGVEEPLARIGAMAYIMDAARRLTVGVIDRGEKPSVLTAIVKRWVTEGFRQVVTDGMDVLGGAGVIRGPRNMLADAYMNAPIAVTVEGANILTRCMIVFGQGALRCHPFAREEVEAAAAGDVARFERAFFRHVGFVFGNGARALLLGLTGASLAPAPVRGPMGSAFSQLSRMSAAFALVADACMGTLGGELKFREKLTGRLADALAWMYLASATLKRFVDEGQLERDLCFARYAVLHALYEIQTALCGVLDNLPARPVAWLLRPVVFPFGARHKRPDDRLGAMVARAIVDGDAREAHARDIFVPGPGEPGLGALEVALRHLVAARPARQKLQAAIRAGKLPKRPAAKLVEPAVRLGLLTPEEGELVLRAVSARDAAIQVDSFEASAYAGTRDYAEQLG